jgi:predicted Holliday junction resolvase-like endonuclease
VKIITNLAGSSFRPQACIDNLRAAENGIPLILEADPANVHDPHAIKVLREQAAAAERKATEAIAQAQREAEQDAARKMKEQEDREANKKHCAAINRGAVAALVQGGVSEDIAKVVVTLIAQKLVPNVCISY